MNSYPRLELGLRQLNRLKLRLHLDSAPLTAPRRSTPATSRSRKLIEEYPYGVANADDQTGKPFEPGNPYRFQVGNPGGAGRPPTRAPDYFRRPLDAHDPPE